MSASSPLALAIGVTANAATLHLPASAPKHLGSATSVRFVHPSELFLAQLRDETYDISEMSVASLAIAYARGNRSWIALPVFTNRRFFYTDIVVRAAAGIETPADLAGRRVGLPEYQQTAAVWARGILSDEFGVDPSTIRWYMERLGTASHAQASGGQLPAGVEINPVPPHSSLGEMLADGELDAVLHYISEPTSIDRASRPVDGVAGTRRLFRQPDAEAARYFANSGVVPMNHCVVVRSALLESHPWLYGAVLKAFEAAKRKAMADFAAMYNWHLITQPWSAISGDPLPYDRTGIQHRSLDTLLRYLLEQGLIDKPLSQDELFAKT